MPKPHHEGSILPLGAAYIAGERAWNFSVYAPDAHGIALLFYRTGEEKQPVAAFRFDRWIHRTTDIWHCRLPEALLAGARYYAYRAEGPSFAASGGVHAFDPEKVLLDPSARRVFFPPRFDRAAAMRPGPNSGRAPLGILEVEESFDWGADRPPRHRDDLIIYEMHVRGFTRRDNSGVPAERRGTFLGVIDKIPHLKGLGITAVELMPVQLFDPQEANYWGYMTLNFFAPHIGYATRPERAKDEFRRMVKALHAAGIEVLLDVVYNHTTEGDQHGPNYSYRGLANRTYYLLNKDPLQPYANYSGTGNTLNCADPAVQNLIVDSLRYWVTEMHVDGFRFDLASALTRRSDGSIDGTAPLLSDIRTDPVLRNVRLIAEPWDAGGAYQLGNHFPGRLWHQWNGRFRDDVRRFLKGDSGMVPDLMRRLYGSDDLFPNHLGYRPLHSINYVIAHDGFSLHDLFAYNERHNRANGWDNTDGPADNYSWNCGHEGEVGAPPEVVALRRRQAKNACALLFLAAGVPMFLAGDEFLNTQRGNNNPYNQDNETTWLDWGRCEKFADVLRFFRLMIRFRREHPTLQRAYFWREDVTWHGVGAAPDLSWDSRSIAYHLAGRSFDDDDLYVMINAWWNPLRFAVQEWGVGGWLRVVDTARESPGDIAEPGEEIALETPEVFVGPRSVVVLRRPRA